MDFERNYQHKILSNQINKIGFTQIGIKRYSCTSQALSTLPACNINSWFITGFVDAEGCFFINIIKHPRCKLGWYVQLHFKITIHKKDINLLKNIKTSWGVGGINHLKESSCYTVNSLKDLLVIIGHFDKYPLITKKQADYLLFKRAVNLVELKEHLTTEGLNKLLSIKAAMNWGQLSDDLKAAFPNITPVDRPDVLDHKIKDPKWLAGFSSGEGSFMVLIRKSSSHKTGFQVELIFKLTQHLRDEKLISSLVEYLDCGNIHIYKETVNWRVSKFRYITDKVIPFFDNHPIQGVKYKDFVDFCKVVALMKNKAHLTQDGLDKINKIKSGMNIKRELD